MPKKHRGMSAAWMAKIRGLRKKRGIKKSRKNKTHRK
jgi:hypothetical protein